MKTTKFLLLLFSGILLLTVHACKKEDPIKTTDYRDAYVGNYEFRKYEHRIGKSWDSSGWEIQIETYDTVLYTGTIAKQDDKKLRIVFEPNATDPVDQGFGSLPSGIRGIIYPTVDSKGELSYPEMVNDYNFFRNAKINNNELYLEYGCNPVNSGQQEVYLRGKKLQ